MLNLLSRVWRCDVGASMVEFAVAFPVLAAVALGTVDLSYLLWQWNAAAKATHLGARKAVTSDPVAQGLADLVDKYWSHEPYALNIGQPCSDATGTPNVDNCPVFTVECTPNAAGNNDPGSCTGNFAFDPAAFNLIFDRMRAVLPTLRREHVRITYRTSGLGFAGQPALPVTISVSIQCMRQDFFFVDALLGLVAPPSACRDGGWPIPGSTTSFTSEDMSTVDPTPASAS